MSKYDPLYHHLWNLETDSWEATFDEIEAILRFSLPDSARQYNPWWANQSGTQHVQCKAWKDAGWRTENVRPTEGRVRFVRAQPNRPSVQAGPATSGKSSFVQAIAEAKSALARKLEVGEEQIEITVKG